jgi:hypothetical protein
MWRDRSVHLGVQGTLDGIAHKDFEWYVMAGNWGDAVNFSKTFK